ncbi:NUDIX domain-containing protein [Candidatus Berkelbacteria bacterium]|nr:NUDIX domain-containing protein [Candidatus Berkelbacteria bacterium]
MVGGEFVLHLRSANCRDEVGRWDPGSGQLEFGLSPDNNVIKEVAEEYGCQGKIIGSLPPHSIFRRHENQLTHWFAIPYFVIVDQDKVRINEPTKIDDLGWFKLRSLPKPLHTGFGYTLKNFRAEFDKIAKLESV